MESAAITTVRFRTFSSPQKEAPSPLALAPCSSLFLPAPQAPSPWRPLIYFLSRWIGLFWTFVGTASYGVWYLVISRLTLLWQVVSASRLPLLCDRPLYGETAFLKSIHQLMDIWVVYTSGLLQRVLL